MKGRLGSGGLFFWLRRSCIKTKRPYTLQTFEARRPTPHTYPAYIYSFPNKLNK
jgi:hypothetical protein